jgi:hypothetical protein
MASEPFDFEEQLEFGLEWEEEVQERLEDMILSLNLQSISFEDNPELQRAGVDHIVSKEEPGIDVKTCSHKYADSELLVFEVMSVVEDGKPGWFWEAESDLIVWVYPNKAKTNLYKRGYLMPLQTGLREWFQEHGEQYDYRRIPNTGKFGEYHTGIRLVPVGDIPQEYLVSFDPRLPTDRETPQSDIQRWADD